MMRASRYRTAPNFIASSAQNGRRRTTHSAVRVGLLVLTCAAFLMMSFPGIFAATQASQANSAATVTTATTTAATYSLATTTSTAGTAPPGNSTAGDNSVAHNPLIPAGLPVGLGCYAHAVGDAEWIAVDCTPASVADKLPRPVIGGGAYGIDGLSVIGTGKILTEGYVTDWFSTYSGEKDTSWGSDSFSIQTNTSLFTGNNGQLDGVQFTEQYSPQGVSQDCVWNVDVTTQTYPHTCVTTPAQPLSSKFGADVVGEVTSKLVCASTGKLGIFCFEEYFLTSVYMTPSGTWAVTAADTYGLHSQWTQTSGTILGLGGGSEAVFTHPTEVGSNVGVYSSGLNSGATRFNTLSYGYWTDESNNLNYQSQSNVCYGDGYCVLWTQQGN
jgi:hypothetical protein